MTRIKDFYQDCMRDGLTDLEISKLEQSDLPGWASISESKLWDNEEGDSEHWSAILLNTVNTAAALGRKGGQSKSEAKKAASRENGKKGGRPKKEKD